MARVFRTRQPLNLILALVFLGAVVLGFAWCYVWWNCTTDNNRVLTLLNFLSSGFWGLLGGFVGAIIALRLSATKDSDDDGEAFQRDEEKPDPPSGEPEHARAPENAGESEPADDLELEPEPETAESNY